MRISDWSSDVCSSDLAGGQQEMALQQGAAVAVMLQYVVSVHRCRFSFPSASQPLARSTELMLAVARRAAIMLVRCFTSRTSISTHISKKSVVRLVIFRLVMLPLRSEERRVGKGGVRT